MGHTTEQRKIRQRVVWELLLQLTLMKPFLFTGLPRQEGKM
jgi:hypothetical protein